MDLLARVAVDMPLSHLDRFFDYTVPENMEVDAVVGARVRVRFRGQACNGFIVERPDTTDTKVPLKPISRVISPEPVLMPAQVGLIRAVADHYGGTFADVMRLAIPPRHAATEVALRPVWPEPITDATLPGGLMATEVGASWLQGVEQGRPLRAFWAIPPVFDRGWQTGVVQAVVACLRAGRGAIVLVPDIDAMDLTYESLSAAVGRGAVARLHHAMGPAQRYREYLGLSRGQARVVVGTRPTVYAPMDNVGLIVVRDEGSDLYIDKHAPYPNTRTTAMLRLRQEKCALLLAGTARSCEAQQLIDRGWLRLIELEPGARRAAAPNIRVGEASTVVRSGLVDGPVLVQVPRAGYLVALACEDCRTRVTCEQCHGPVEGQRSEDGARRLACRWCGRVIVSWRCTQCGGATLRAPVVGSGRTAEELGRAFPGFKVIDSSGDHVVARVGDKPALVIATPGAEPWPDAGYAAAVIMDADITLSLPDLRVAEEAIRRWFTAVALVRPGGVVGVLGDEKAPAIQALVRVDPGGFAARELAERLEAGLPPARTFVVATGEPDSLAGLAALVGEQYERFGPVDAPVPGEALQQRLIWHCAPADAPGLCAAIKAAMAQRVATKTSGVVRVQVDPYQVV